MAADTKLQDSKPKVLGIREAKGMAHARGDEAAAMMLRRIEVCKSSKQAEMNRLSDLCDRYDDLYYPSTITEGGADHWPEDPNRAKKGAVHVSVNTYAGYVDIPAALQSVTPIENIVSNDETQQGATDLAAAMERLYFAWKEHTDFELKSRKTAVVKNLYGRGAAKVFWDDDLDAPQVTVIDQPRNLWLGWRSTEYDRLDWAFYVYRLTPMAVIEEFGLEVTPVAYDGVVYPSVSYPGTTFEGAREWNSTAELGMLEVYDYWYRKPKGTPKKGERTEMVTYNAIVVGDCLIKDDPHPEYEGELPFIPVFNTYIPGLPDGKPALYDAEQLLREKDERISAGGAMVNKAIAGQFWQLVGPDAPEKVPNGVQPVASKVVAPGPGNRIESIEPWMPEFQLENYLQRIDRELVDATGLNDLLRGLAPAQVLSSGKAINALVANYEARIDMSRTLFYKWRTDVWRMVGTVWGNKAPKMKPMFEAADRLVLKNPSLTPRDDLETSTLAVNLLDKKVWSMERAMDAMGVEDPQAEMQRIREQRTDAALFPADVQVQVALAAQLQQMNMQAAQMSAQQQGPAPMTPEQGQAGLMAEGAATGMPSLNGPGEQPIAPEQPANASDMALQSLMSGGFQQGEDYNAVNQTMVSEGEPKNRLLLQQPISPAPPPGG